MSANIFEFYLSICYPFKKAEKRYTMKIIVPNYYKKFKCIADKCRHSCCVGWEIDIDKETFVKYSSIQGDFGKRLNENIQFLDGVTCFKLGADERCPFLNKNNLCDIILNLGEESLCQICNDHPRFRNFYEGTTEIGLGLCCEAAADLIISQNEKVTFEINDDDGVEKEFTKEENEFIELRSKAFEILQNRSKSIDNRTKDFLKLCNANNFEISKTETADLLLSLERLDSKWTDILEELKASADFSNSALPSSFNTIAEQLLVYFTYRHLSGFLDDGRLLQRALFIVFSYKAIEMLCKHHLEKFSNISYSDIVEYARLYSSEIILLFYNKINTLYNKNCKILHKKSSMKNHTASNTYYFLILTIA